MATPTRRRIPVLVALCLVLVGAAVLTPYAEAGTKPAFVQKGNGAAESGTELTVRFGRANKSGNLIIAYVVWDNVGPVAIKDTLGNPYQVAVGPTQSSGNSQLRAQIFYARDVAAGMNEVTATFATPVTAHAELYVHEYSGLSHVAPLDATAGGAGVGQLVDTGDLSTHASEELLFLAIASDGRSVSRLTRGYKTRARVRGVLTADTFAGDAGEYRANAEQSGVGWVAQLVAFNYSGQRAKDTAKFPLKVGPLKRYLVGQDDKPFLLTGDSPQSLFVNLTLREASSYFSNRKSRGFNAVWINLLSSPGTGGRDDATTYDGIPPFLHSFDLSTPNEEYFARVDEFIRLAAKNGITVLLNPAETIDWIPTLKAAGTNAAFNYGRYLGERYRGFDNIVWMYGNDFQSWPTDPEAVGVLQSVARGIRSMDKAHLHTVQLDFEVSGSLDDPSWAPLIDLSATYTYAPTYAQILKDYHRGQPTFLVEANYDLETDPNESPGLSFYRGDNARPRSIRKQAWWTMLSGATGHVYGNGYVWPFHDGWKKRYDSKAARQMGVLRKLLESLRWYDLVPDESHSLVTDGFGEFQDGNPDSNGPEPHASAHVNDNQYATAAATDVLGLVYIPTLRDITVNLSQLQGPAVTARWFDPTNGKFKKITGSPFMGGGERVFTPPGLNGDKDPDWVLVLEAD